MAGQVKRIAAKFNNEINRVPDEEQIPGDWNTSAIVPKY